MGSAVVLAGQQAIAGFLTAPVGQTTELTNTYGTPGALIDMPTAEMAPDGQLSASTSYFSGVSRTTLTFQFLPRLSASFRYSGIRDLSPSFSTFYDRSFDLRFRLIEEGAVMPAVSLGMQDIGGTGLYSAEYIAATKSIGDKLRLTGGLGWGRLGSANSFASFGTRKKFTPGSTGGKFSTGAWFRGDISAFAGASYDVTDKLTLSAEYSSDNYAMERRVGLLNRKTPFNFAIDYQLARGVNIGAFALHGDQIGALLTFTLNPGDSSFEGGLENAPLPVAVRSQKTASDLGWNLEPARRAKVVKDTQDLLTGENVVLERIALDGTTANVVIRNEIYDMRAEAVGRAVRALTRTLPPSVEVLRVTLTARGGLPADTITLRRSDVEKYENEAAGVMLKLARFDDPLRFGGLPDPLPGTYPRFNWSLGPYSRTSFFDPDNPLRLDVGVRAKAEAQLGHGWVTNAQVSVKLAGTLDGIRPNSNSTLPHVRTLQGRYSQTDTPTIDRLTVAKYGRPARNLYSRITVGYLEEMYAGLSSEVLWAPVDSRLALGIEANYVQPRAFDQRFGLRTRDTRGGTIPHVNGHASVYYQMPHGFQAQLDMGRYLAGDWGGTVSLDREFGNGWKIGGFVTKTNVSAQQFGEGSFDKGIRITIPFSWVLGKPTKQSTSMVLRPLTRDGGVRLDVDGRLYDSVRPTHKVDVVRSWGKFWR